MVNKVNIYNNCKKKINFSIIKNYIKNNIWNQVKVFSAPF